MKSKYYRETKKVLPTSIRRPWLYGCCCVYVSKNMWGNQVTLVSNPLSIICFMFRNSFYQKNITETCRKSVKCTFAKAFFQFASHAVSTPTPENQISASIQLWNFPQLSSKQIVKVNLKPSKLWNQISCQNQKSAPEKSDKTKKKCSMSRSKNVWAAVRLLHTRRRRQKICMHASKSNNSRWAQEKLL